MIDSSIEIWKDIPGYEGLYQASNLGNIRSLDHKIMQKGVNGKLIIHKYKGKILKGWVQNTGYLTVSLNNKKYSVHRIVAQTFIHKIDGKTFVNHIDGNKLNNKVENLEWCTNAENIQHAYRNGLMENAIKFVKTHKIRAKKINQYDLDGNYIKTFIGSVEAQNELRSIGIKVNAGNIRNVCQGKRKKAGGYIWRYYDRATIKVN